MTRDLAPAELLAEEVGRLHEWLAARKLKTMMWGDQLLPEHNGGSPYFTARAIDKLPKDIVIADWHYDPAEQFPSVAYFKQHGFPVVACGWWEPLNVWNFPTVEVPIEYRQTITDWNDGLPHAQASCIWSSTDAGGAYVALSTYRWGNPYPDKIITCLDITSLDSPLPVAVLAVTAAVR